MSSLFDLPVPSTARLLEAQSERQAAREAADAPTIEPARSAARRFRWTIPLAIALVIGSLLIALLLQRRVAALPRVRVVPVLRGHIAASIPAVSAGRVTAASELTLRSEAVGRIARVLVEPGTQVVKGDALLELEADELDRTVRAAESGYRMARAAAAEAELRAKLALHAAKRTRELVALGSLARVEDESKGYEAEVLTQAAAAANARVAGQRAELEGAERARAHGVVKAPISGLVTSVAVVAGESVAAGAPLVGLADVSKLHVAAQVDESDASHVDLGMPVDLHFEGDEGPPLRSRITRIDPRVTDTAQGGRVLGLDVGLPPDRKWRLGVSAEVDIISDERDRALLVPASAVIGSGKERQLFVFVAGRALLRHVEAGLTDFAQVEIVRGLSAGERVVENPARAGLSTAGEVRLEAARPEEH